MLLLCRLSFLTIEIRQCDIYCLSDNKMLHPTDARSAYNTSDNKMLHPTDARSAYNTDTLLMSVLGNGNISTDHQEQR